MYVQKPKNFFEELSTSCYVCGVYIQKEDRKANTINGTAKYQKAYRMCGSVLVKSKRDFLFSYLICPDCSDETGKLIKHEVKFRILSSIGI